MVRLLGVAALSITLIGATVVSPKQRAREQRAGSIQLNLHNKRWVAVKVEVRVGTAASCDLDTDAWVRTLHKGETWGVVASTPVCWRSESVPSSASTPTTWSSWQQPAIADGASVDADL